MLYTLGRQRQVCRGSSASLSLTVMLRGTTADWGCRAPSALGLSRMSQPHSHGTAAPFTSTMLPGSCKPEPSGAERLHAPPEYPLAEGTAAPSQPALSSSPLAHKSSFQMRTRSTRSHFGLSPLVPFPQTLFLDERLRKRAGQGEEEAGRSSDHTHPVCLMRSSRPAPQPRATHVPEVRAELPLPEERTPPAHLSFLPCHPDASMGFLRSLSIAQSTCH